MHTYDSDDSDNFICDECDSLITGLVYRASGKDYKSNNQARGGNEHYCYGCCFGHAQEE